MKIGVISDTHIPRKAPHLPEIVYDIFKDADHIFHAGDISDLSVIEELGRLAPVTAVAGNTDLEELRRYLGESRIVSMGGKTFGIFHGHGIIGTTPDRARRKFENNKPDCIIFGHSHIPYCGYDGRTLLFNPGSPTDKRRNAFYSVGILEVGDMITPRLIYFNSEGKLVSL
ncbi:MAG: metallophosphoesterase family protein [Oscillospiraceae bacterium]